MVVFLFLVVSGLPACTSCEQRCRISGESEEGCGFAEVKDGRLSVVLTADPNTYATIDVPSEATSVHVTKGPDGGFTVDGEFEALGVVTGGTSWVSTTSESLRRVSVYGSPIGLSLWNASQIVRIEGEMWSLDLNFDSSRNEPLDASVAVVSRGMITISGDAVFAVEETSQAVLAVAEIAEELQVYIRLFEDDAELEQEWRAQLGANVEIHFIADE